MFRIVPKKSVLFQRIASSPTDIEPNESRDIMMYDVNIKEITKAELSNLSLSLFSSTDIEPSKSGDIMMHDVNIEEMTKAELIVLALSLFSNIWTSIHFQFGRIGHILKSILLRQ